MNKPLFEGDKPIEPARLSIAEKEREVRSGSPTAGEPEQPLNEVEVVNLRFSSGLWVVALIRDVLVGAEVEALD